MGIDGKAMLVCMLFVIQPRTCLKIVDVDVSFGDVVDDLKPSGMVFFTEKKGAFGIPRGRSVYGDRGAEQGVGAPVSDSRQRESLFGVDTVWMHPVHALAFCHPSHSSR